MRHNSLSGPRDDPYGTANPDEDPHLQEDDDRVGRNGDYSGADTDITGEPGGEPTSQADDALRPTDRPGAEASGPAHRTETNESIERDWAFDKVIVVAVSEATDYLAAAMAASSLSLRTPGVNSRRLPDRYQPYRFVYDFAAEPAKQLTDEWGDLPDVAAVSEQAGQRLFETAIEKTWGNNDDGVDPEASHLYNSDGEPITDHGTAQQLRDTTDDEELYMVPALALSAETSRSVAEKEADRKQRQLDRTPNRTELSCRSCGERMVHTFDQFDEPYEGEEDEHGQPIWSCRGCGASRYGPVPTS
jgi:hypothetical protein